MTAMIGPPREHDWTIADLADLPDDGLRYELVDGVLLVSAAPVPRHQRATGEVFVALRDAAPDDLEVFVGPLDFQPDDRRSFEPDVLVVRRSDIGDKAIHKPLVLAVEVLSPSTRSVDLVLKRAMYEESGVESYWLVDPDEPSILVLELRDGRFVEIANAVGSEFVDVETPYPVRIRPADLVNG